LGHSRIITSFTYNLHIIWVICILIERVEGIDPAAMFVYITWPWRHFRWAEQAKWLAYYC